MTAGTTKTGVADIPVVVSVRASRLRQALETLDSRVRRAAALSKAQT